MTNRFARSATAALLAVLTGAPAVPAGGRDGSDPLPPDVAALPVCSARDVVAPPSHWERHSARGFSWLQPGNCQRKDDTSFAHGGEQWACGSADIRVTWGHWGLISFEDVTACRVELRGIPAVVMQGADLSKGRIVWYLLGVGSRHEPVIAVSGSDAALHAVAFSGTRIPRDASPPPAAARRHTAWR